MKSKLFTPKHEVPQQNPLGEIDSFGWPPDDKRFGNAQDVPDYSTFGAGRRKAVPTTPVRNK